MNSDYAGYFDYAAATPLDSRVKQKMEPFFNDLFYNPSAIYLKARDVRIAKEEARHRVARAIGSKESEIIFTAGGTEANNLAVVGLSKVHAKGHFICIATDHDSMINPVKSTGNFDIVGVDNKGFVNISELSEKICDDTVLVSVCYANNEIGTIQPVKEILAVIESERKSRLVNKNSNPIYLHIDAAQATNYLDLSVSRLGVDLMSINSGKIYGPKQVGCLFVKAGIKISPLIEGGGQENGLRSGSENVAGLAGFSYAIEQAVKNRKSESLRLIQLRDYFIKQINQFAEKSFVNGAKGNKRLANNISLTIPGIDNEYFLMQLDELGFMVATGSACSASSEEPSHVLQSIGLSKEEIFSTVRITFGRFTAKESIDNLLGAIKNTLK
jgi:cysteine desulfurase